MTGIPRDAAQIAKWLDVTPLEDAAQAIASLMRANRELEAELDQRCKTIARLMREAAAAIKRAEGGSHGGQ